MSEGLVSFSLRLPSRRVRRCSAVGTNDLHPATLAGMNGQLKAVQLYDRSYKTEAKAHAWRISYLVGTVETPQHRLALLFADAAAGIRYAYDGFAVAAQ